MKFSHINTREIHPAYRAVSLSGPYKQVLSNDKLLLIIFFFCAFFPSFISNTSILTINFRANLNAQNAGNGISGLQISKIFWGNPPDPVAFSHSYPSPIYLTERSLFSTNRIHRKIHKKGPDQ
jgi:hypothetical protein